MGSRMEKDETKDIQNQENIFNLSIKSSKHIRMLILVKEVFGT